MENRMLAMLYLIILILSINGVFALTQLDLIDISKDYVNNTLISEEKNKLESIYLPMGEKGGFYISLKGINITEEGIIKIDSVNLWVVPVNLNFEITKEIIYSFGDIEREKVISKEIIKDIYIDSNGKVVESLFKIKPGESYIFECSNEETDKCNGFLIRFNESYVVDYFWQESSLLMESCLCQNKDKEECGEKPIVEEKFIYKEDASDSWTEVKDRIKNSCIGYESFRSIELLNNTEDYFEFRVRINNREDVASQLVKRELDRTYSDATLRFEKSNGRILEKLRMDDPSKYEEILKNDNDVIVKYNDIYFSSPDELLNIVQYDWVNEVDPFENDKLESRDFSNEDKKNYLFYYVVVILVIMISIILLLLIKLKNSK